MNQIHTPYSYLQVVDKLQLKLDRYLSLLKTTKLRVEYLYMYHLRQPIHYTYDCCSIPNSQLR